MEEDKLNNRKTKKKIKGKEDQTDLPFCTATETAEQARANEDNEPCDDGRSGGVEKE